MANAEHLAKLREGVEAWNSWRKEDRIVGLDLSEANLSQADLSGADLVAANLSGANLKLAELRYADLSWANLSGPNLSPAFLAGANLSGANLSQADLSGADLGRTDLSRANLSGTDLRAYLGGAYLNRTDLSQANLSGAVLEETILADLDLSTTKGLDSCAHSGPSVLDHRTLEHSGRLPINFLRGVGLPEALIDYLPSLLGRAVEFYSCFISYSHADPDKAFARRLHDQLQGRGIRCWLDEHQLLPGQSILDEVDRGIRLWDKTLLCCSEASLQGSPWVDREIGKALEKEERLWRERGEKVLALIPLDLDGYLWRWDGGKASILRERFAPDFTGWEADNAKVEQQFERVMKALRMDREPPPVSRL